MLVELCKKSIAICEAYDLYNDNGDWKTVAQAQYRALYGECKNTLQELMNNTRNYGTNGADKHKRICQRLCQEELGKRVYLDQRAAMRAGLKYEGHNHKKAANRLYTVNNLLVYLAENATKFTTGEMCCNIIPAMLKPRARVEYVKMCGEDLVKKQDIVNLLRTISKDIECEIDVGAPGNAPPSTKAATTSRATATAADSVKTVRIPACDASQVITMPGRTARTTSGHAIAKDLRATTATV